MSYLQTFSVSSNVICCYCSSIELVRARACIEGLVIMSKAIIMVLGIYHQDKGYHNMHEVMASSWLVQGHIGHYDQRESRATS